MEIVPSPKNSISADLKSFVERPFKYKIGSSDSTFGNLRKYGSKINEKNFRLLVGRQLEELSDPTTNTENKSFQNYFWSGELWGDGYFCRTEGEGLTAGLVRRYLVNHADKGLEPAQGELFPKERVRPKRP